MWPDVEKNTSKAVTISNSGSKRLERLGQFMSSFLLLLSEQTARRRTGPPRMHAKRGALKNGLLIWGRVIEHTQFRQHT